MMSISPSFFGFQTAQRSLLAAQTALNVVNHNVSNANVEGYTRQRVDLATAYPLKTSGAGFFIGQGLDVTGITQLRDSFLDKQYRQEQAVQGEVKTAATLLGQTEGIIGEPSFSGLSNRVQAMFDAVSDMRNNPQSLPARTAFIQQSRDMIRVFQQQGQQLVDLHQNLVGTSTAASWPNSQLGLRVNDVNTKIALIADLNRQIGISTSANAVPNDLIDKRNLMLEQISKVIDVRTTDMPNYQVSLSIGGEDVLRGGKVLDTLALTASTLPNADRIPARITTVNGAVDITNTIASGEVKAVLDVAGNNTSIKNVYSTFEDLSNMLETLSTQFNNLQATGRDLAGTLHTADAYTNLYTLSPSYVSGPKLLYLNVNTSFDNNMDKISLANNDPTAPANFAGVGDSRNAGSMAAIKNTIFGVLNNNTLEGFHQNFVSALGTDTKSYSDRNESQKDLLNQLQVNRQAVSGVNTDEEGLDMIKYQRMFEASSRIVQTYNEIYKSIINMVG
jgi:flagellar hook-associated protein 1 FlgK